jgi:hypothetical protein
MTMKRSGPERLTDGELKAHLRNLAARERAELIEWLEYLAEMDRRRAYLADGASSLFAWCRENLLLGEWAAHARIRAARAMRKFPVLAARLASGELNLDAVARLAPHLTPDNHLALFDEARFAPRRVIDAIVARFQPEASRRSRIVARRGPDRSGVADVQLAVETDLAAPAGVFAGNEAVAPSEVAAPSNVAARSETAAPTDVTTPTPTIGARLAGRAATPPLVYRVHLTLSSRAHDDLERLRELMRHQVPDGDPAVVIELALRMLRSRVEARTGARAPKKVRAPGAGDRAPVGAPDRAPVGGPEAAPVRPPECAPTAPPGRYIPMAVRRAVRERDGDRCAFRSREGRMCGERAWLEFHHLVPHARGGMATPGNLELRCRAHNRYEAEREFDGFVRERPIRYESGVGRPTVVCHSSRDRRPGAATVRPLGRPSHRAPAPNGRSEAPAALC